MLHAVKAHRHLLCVCVCVCVHVCICVLYVCFFFVLAGITAANKPPTAPGNGLVAIAADSPHTGTINKIRGGCSNNFKYM